MSDLYKGQFIAENRHTVEGSVCTVHVTPSTTNDGSNSDAWRITINTGDSGGQPMVMNGQERAYVSFVVIGRWELTELCDLLPAVIEASRTSFPEGT